MATHTGNTSSTQGLSRRYEKRPLDPEAARFYDACERGFAVLAIFLFSGALVPLLRLGPGVQVVEGDPVLLTMWFVLYGITAFLILARWRLFVYVATRDKLLLLLVGVALLSILWSFAPQYTLRREVALIGTTLFGAYLATRYSLDELLRLLAWALGIAALLSLIFALMLPYYGMWIGPEGTESWQGVFVGGKNVLGRTMALSASVFVLLALSTRKHRLVLWSGLLLSAGLLWMSESATPLIALCTILLLLPLYQALRSRYTLSVSLFILAVVAGGIAVTWLVANAENVLLALGKDPTLTGRKEIWPAVIEMIRQHPWLGYGYGAFWGGGWSGESAHVSLWVTRFPNDPAIVHAHNGFLDLLLDLGLLGLATFALGFSLATLRAVYWVRATRTTAGLWPLVYLTFILLYNFTESSILAHNNVFWILYVTISMLTAARFPATIRMTRWMLPRPGDSRRRQAPAFSEGKDV